MGPETAADGSASLRSWLRWPVSLAILGVAVLQSPQIPASFSDLHRSFAEVFDHAAAWRHNLETPGAGNAVLSEPVLLAVDLLRTNGIDAYRYSSAIASDPFVRQRLIEGAWPIRHRPGAAVVVSYLAEPNDCPVIAERAAAVPAGGVRLARCP